MIFPFLADSTMGTPRLVSATLACGVSSERSLPVNDSRQPWTWHVDFNTADTCKVTMVYSQSVRGRRASYLLTSCKYWPTPLRHARIEVLVSGAIGELSFTLPLRKVYDVGSSRLYAADFEDWTPEEDLVVGW
jgi:hypothetical protein